MGPYIIAEVRDTSLIVVAGDEASPNRHGHTRALGVGNAVAVQVVVRGGTCSVFLDGEEQGGDLPLRMSTRRAPFFNTAVFAGDPWDPPAPVEIRNLTYTNLSADEIIVTLSAEREDAQSLKIKCTNVAGNELAVLSVDS